MKIPNEHFKSQMIYIFLFFILYVFKIVFAVQIAPTKRNSSIVCVETPPMLRGGPVPQLLLPPSSVLFQPPSVTEPQSSLT